MERSYRSLGPRKKETTIREKIMSDFNDLSYLEYGDEIADIELLQRYPRVQNLNEHMLRRKTSAERGAFGIKLKSEDEGFLLDEKFGKREQQPHMDNTKSWYSLATRAEICVIGVSPDYKILETKIEGMQLRQDIVHQRVDDLGEGQKCASYYSLGVVFKNDPARQVHEWRFKGSLVNDAKKLIGKIGELTSIVGRYLDATMPRPDGKKHKYHCFGLWLPIAIGESYMTGSTAQSLVTPVKIHDDLLLPTDLETLTKKVLDRRVSRDEYAQFAGYRIEWDKYAKDTYADPFVVEQQQRRLGAVNVAALPSANARMALPAGQ